MRLGPDQPIERSHRFFRAGAEPLVPLHQPRRLRIGLRCRTCGCRLDPGQRPIEPPDRKSQPLICHKILTSTLNRQCKRLSLARG